MEEQRRLWESPEAQGEPHLIDPKSLDLAG